MARRIEKDDDFQIDMDSVSQEGNYVPVEKTAVEERKPQRREVEINTTVRINPLRNERINVRYLMKKQGIWGDDPKHVLAGGMAENATKTFVVPLTSSNGFTPILTEDERTYLEDLMGLERNTMSFYKKEHNYWDCSEENGDNIVVLTKGDNYFDLSNPDDYIKYKILLANKNHIAPSLAELQDRPRATYQFVIVSDAEEGKLTKSNMSFTMQCYKEFGKIENDFDMLKAIVEQIEGRPIAKTAKIEFLQNKCNTLIQSDAKMFLMTVTDPLLPTKILINKCVDEGLISKRSDLYFLKSDGSPLCNDNEESTLTSAAKYLNLPKHQELKLSLEAKLNN